MALGRLELGYTSISTTCVFRHDRISIEGTCLGEMLSAIRLAKRSSSFNTSGIPLTIFEPSSTPIRRVPPEVLANAMIVLSGPSGEVKSRLNSSVFPSRRLRSVSRSTTLHFTLMGEDEWRFRAQLQSRNEKQPLYLAYRNLLLFVTTFGMIWRWQRLEAAGNHWNEKQR